MGEIRNVWRKNQKLKNSQKNWQIEKFKNSKSVKSTKFKIIRNRTKLNKKDYEFKMSHLSLKIVKMDEIGETRKKIKWK